MIHVTANHSDPRWQLADQAFALVDAGEWDGSYRIGGSAANGGFDAIATNFGCGRSCRTPSDAIHSLLQSNGCSAIVITERQP